MKRFLFALAFGCLLAAPAVAQEGTVVRTQAGSNHGSLVNGHIPIATGSSTVGDSGSASAPPNGTAGGDLSGTYPNPTVSKINGSTPGALSLLGVGAGLNSSGGNANVTYGSASSTAAQGNDARIPGAGVAATDATNANGGILEGFYVSGSCDGYPSSQFGGTYGASGQSGAQGSSTAWGMYTAGCQVDWVNYADTWRGQGNTGALFNLACIYPGAVQPDCQLKIRYQRYGSDGEFETTTNVYEQAEVNLTYSFVGDLTSGQSNVTNLVFDPARTKFSYLNAQVYDTDNFSSPCIVQGDTITAQASGQFTLAHNANANCSGVDVVLRVTDSVHSVLSPVHMPFKANTSSGSRVINGFTFDPTRVGWSPYTQITESSNAGADLNSNGSVRAVIYTSSTITLGDPTTGQCTTAAQAANTVSGVSFTANLQNGRDTALAFTGNLTAGSCAIASVSINPNVISLVNGSQVDDFKGALGQPGNAANDYAKNAAITSVDSAHIYLSGPNQFTQASLASSVLEIDTQFCRDTYILGFITRTACEGYDQVQNEADNLFYQPGFMKPVGGGAAVALWDANGNIAPPRSIVVPTAGLGTVGTYAPVEMAATNLLTYSNAFSNSAWTSNDLNISAEVQGQTDTTPDGVANAWLVTSNGAAGYVEEDLTVTPSSTNVYAFSVFIGTSSPSTNYAIREQYTGGVAQQYTGSGTIGSTATPSCTASATCEIVNRSFNGYTWQRVTIASSDTSGGNSTLKLKVYVNGTSGGASSIKIYGAQLETIGAQSTCTGSDARCPTSYIPTGSTPVTRPPGINESVIPLATVTTPGSTPPLTGSTSSVYRGDGTFGSNKAVSIIFGTPADNQVCSLGDVFVDASFVYACAAPNTWKRAALSSY